MLPFELPTHLTKRKVDQDLMPFMAQAFHEVGEFFKWDYVKTGYWMNTPNPMLGGAIPMNMIFSGRGEKLLKIIHNLKEGYSP